MDKNVILVVDDEPDALTVLRDILEVTGYRVATARNGREALDYLDQHAPPALMFLDLSMPVINGVRLLGALQSGAYPRLAHTAIVVVSAVSDSFDLRGFQCTGMIRKPIDVDRILGMAERFAPLSGQRPAPGAASGNESRA